MTVTKQELLGHLAQVRGVDAEEVAAAFGVPYPTAAMALLRLTRQGLVTRALDPASGLYWYALSPRGLERLRYFND
jgi:DNA-binding IclR family transcriptional regulator